MSDAKRPVQSQTKAKKLGMMTHCTIRVISAFVFTLANILFSHDAAHMTSKMTSSLPAMWPFNYNELKIKVVNAV